MDQGAFLQRYAGRIGSEELLETGAVVIAGDIELGRRVLDALAVMI
jgi:hypothetical protein